MIGFLWEHVFPFMLLATILRPGNVTKEEEE